MSAKYQKRTSPSETRVAKVDECVRLLLRHSRIPRFAALFTCTRNSFDDGLGNVRNLPIAIMAMAIGGMRGNAAGCACDFFATSYEKLCLLAGSRET